MSLLLPDAGLLFWMLISFGVVFIILAKWGFPVIVKMVNERKEFIDIIQKVFDQGVDMFLIEHNMDVVMNLSHDITVLNFGCKIAEGAPKEILENEEVISAYLGEGYRKQMKKEAEQNA